MVASDPFLELFRSLRNAFIRRNASPDIQRTFDPMSAIQDYYFTGDQIRIMDMIQVGDVNTPFDSDEWDRFLELCIRRAKLESGDLVPYLVKLRGSTYKEILDKGLEIIATARNATDRQWIGTGDSWTIEFVAPLARAYPDARFLVILRDPRAMINSMLGVARIDPLQVAQVLSYARHWRKYVAFVIHYQNDSVFSRQLHILTHEQLLRDPEKQARQICDFLEVEYDPAMLDTDKYFDYMTGAIWKGNSSFEEITSGISVHRAERWRTQLSSDVINLVDLVCGPDMKLIGYEPLSDFDNRWPSPAILEHLIRNNRQHINWRSDIGDVQQDYGFELFRRALLSTRERSLESDLIRRSFLFEEVFDRLQQNGSNQIIV